MSEERRYRDDEVRQIFALATTGQEGEPAPVSASEGLTLAELQAVGLEVGVEPELVARAAQSLDANREVLPRGRTLGMPISVGRLVELPRNPTDREWELLVTELRTTFGAKGIVSSHGGFREWSNGNLHALIEPTESGYQLRLATVKSGAVEMNLLGGIFFSFAAMLSILLIAKGKPEALALPAFFAAAGVAGLGWNIIRLPRWASRREKQMEQIANRAKELLSSAPPDHDPAGGDHS